MNPRSSTPAPRPHVIGPDGTAVYLDDLQMAALRLACGHVKKGLGYAKGDLFFCDTCSDYKRVAKVVAN